MPWINLSEQELATVKRLVDYAETIEANVNDSYTPKLQTLRRIQAALQRPQGQQVWQPVQDGEYPSLAPVSVERLVMRVEDGGNEISQVYADIPAGINTIYLPDDIRLCRLTDAPVAGDTQGVGVSRMGEKIEFAIDLEYATEEHDGEHLMLAILCGKEIVYTWDNKLLVECNDMFAWALADLEPITLSEIPDLFGEWRKDRDWGPLKWVAKKRNRQPQVPVIDMIKKQGKWDEEWEALDFGSYNRYMQERALKHSHPDAS